jgi:hypothetical protein
MQENLNRKTQQENLEQLYKQMEQQEKELKELEVDNS